MICQWLAAHAREKVLLASISKGSGDVKAAMARPDAAAAFRPVAAWLNLSGITDGSPTISLLRRRPLTVLAYRALCWWKKLDFGVYFDVVERGRVCVGDAVVPL